MPAVPITQGHRVRAEPLGGGNLRAVDATAGLRAVGAGMQNLGQAGGQYAQAEEALAAERDEAQTRLADVAAAPELSAVEAEYRALRGTQATPEALSAAQQRIVSIREQQSKALTTPRQQRMFTEAFQQREAAALQRMQGHGVEQVRVATIETAEARVQTSAGLAVDSYADPDEFNRNLATMHSESQTIARAQGWGEEKRQAWLGEQVSSVHRRVVETLRAGDAGPRAAQGWLDQYGSEISDQDERILRESLVPGLEEAQYEDDIRSVLGVAGPERPDEPAPPVAKVATRPTPEALAFNPKMIVRSGVRGQGAAEHRARKSGNAIDIPGRMGDPVYPPIDGKVISVDNDPGGAGGKQVLVRHPDGRVTGYAHLSRVTAKEGDDVGPGRPVGGLGSTGRSSGPHVHFTTRVNGVKVDPETQKWGGARGGGEPLITYEPKMENTERLYAAAATKAGAEGWSQKRYERVLKGIDATANRNQALLADKERLASRAVTEAVISAGPGGITSLKQLGAAFYDLSPSERGSYVELVRKNNEPKEPAWDPLLMLELSDQLATNPQAFASRNAAADLQRLPKGAQSTYISMRRSALGETKQKPGEIRQVEHSKIVNVAKPLLDAALPVDPKLKGADLKEAQKERAERILQFRQTMTERLTEFQRLNKAAPGDDDIFKMASRVLTQMKFSDDTRGFYFEAPTRRGNAIVPTAEVQRIRSEYQRRYGEVPPDRVVQDIWFKEGMAR